MTNNVYCRDCGVVESSRLHHGCSVCGQDVYATIPAHITAMQDEIAALKAELARARDALEKLARLGNGDSYGNSVGNEIAIKALRSPTAQTQPTQPR